MGITYKVLGQSNPVAVALTDLYAVPAATQTVASTIAICNRDAAVHKYRVSVAPAGALDRPAQYLFYDVQIAANATDVWTLGLSLAATDKIRVYADAQQLSFSLFGAEMT